jgi:peptidyl-prolyl cis-trans isomerase B (cyclophilin B)
MYKKLLIVFIGVLIMSCNPKDAFEKSIKIDNDVVAVISTNLGDMVLEFYPKIAPKHVESFIKHAENGYYDGTTFHRVIPDFMIQGGDPNSRNEDRTTHGMGGNAGAYFGIGDENNPETWMLPEEFSNKPHARGILSMARAQNPNSAGSQFFICVADANFLNNNYTVFGNVIKGMDVADQIVNSARDGRDNPFERIEMKIKIVPKNEVEGLE